MNRFTPNPLAAFPEDRSMMVKELVHRYIEWKFEISNKLEELGWIIKTTQYDSFSLAYDCGDGQYIHFEFRGRHSQLKLTRSATSEGPSYSYIDYSNLYDFHDSRWGVELANQMVAIHPNPLEATLLQDSFIKSLRILRHAHPLLRPTYGGRDDATFHVLSKLIFSTEVGLKYLTLKEKLFFLNHVHQAKGRVEPELAKTRNRVLYGLLGVGQSAAAGLALLAAFQPLLAFLALCVMLITTACYLAQWKRPSHGRAARYSQIYTRDCDVCETPAVRGTLFHNACLSG